MVKRCGKRDIFCDQFKREESESDFDIRNNQLEKLLKNSHIFVFFLYVTKKIVPQGMVEAPANYLRGKTTKRIQKEYMDMQTDPPENCSAGPISEDEFDKWEATIIGPAGTPYQDGIFRLEIYFPPNYPYTPPKIIFRTPIFHCNIKEGQICLDILTANKWSPALTISKVLLSISSMLADQNSSDPLNKQAADLYINNRPLFEKTAKDYVRRHASMFHSFK